MGDLLPDSTYDFIIVGGGTAGCTLASALSRTRSAPTVLLLEAGGHNTDPTWHNHEAFMSAKNNPAANWNYRSVPSPATGGRPIELDRGKGLGGSSAINFTYWTRGSRDDYDEIARRTGDAAWAWEAVAERWRGLEGYEHNVPPEADKYYRPREGGYGTRGPLKLCAPASDWTADAKETTDVWVAEGYPLNVDMSDGDPIGLLSTPFTARGGVRTSSAVLLADVPPNLHILTDAHVARVEFDGTTATGVALLDGRRFAAAREVLLAAGAVDSPKLLLLSGVGPAAALAALGIPLVHANAQVGRDLRDHYHMSMLFSTRAGCASRVTARVAGGHAMGWFKSDAVVASPEFAALPAEVQGFLNRPTVPLWEMVHRGATPAAKSGLGDAVGVVSLFVMNSQGAGSVVLKSSDPAEAPAVQVSYLEHPFDKRVAVEATREAMKIAFNPATSTCCDEGAIHICPKSQSEEDILAYWRDNVQSTWHLTGSCLMGKSQEGDKAVVDSDFKVFGVERLRVIDMSAVPLLVNAHTQACAYQVALIAAEKLIKQCGLDG